MLAVDKPTHAGGWVVALLKVVPVGRLRKPSRHGVLASWEGHPHLGLLGWLPPLRRGLDGS